MGLAAFEKTEIGSDSRCPICQRGGERDRMDSAARPPAAVVTIVQCRLAKRRGEAAVPTGPRLTFGVPTGGRRGVGPGPGCRWLFRATAWPLSFGLRPHIAEEALAGLRWATTPVVARINEE